MKFSLIALNGLATVALAATTSSRTVHEKRGVDGHRWTKRDALDADHVIPVRIALKQRNLENGMDYLLKVSDPASPDYGKHYSAEEVTELFAPADESIVAVKKWLVDSGVDANTIRVTPSKGWIAFQSTAGQLESVLNTKYHVYTHATSDYNHIGTDEYTLPKEISDIVDFITPGVAPAKTTQLAQGNSKRSLKHVISPKPVSPKVAAALANDPLAQCDQYVTPACIAAQYHIPQGTLANPNNKLGVYEADGEAWANKDLDTFYAKYAPFVKAGTYPVNEGIQGGKAPTDPSYAGGEATLDYEIAIPIVYPQGTINYEVNLPDKPHALFNSFLDAIDGSYCTYEAYGEKGDDQYIDGPQSNECGTYKPTNVISISYGDLEPEYPVNYLKRQCNEWMKLGLRGTTVLLASGDDGVAPPEGPCLGDNEDIFVPDAVSSCPYMTSVGSTYIREGGKIGDPESATTSFPSGGGFSNIFATPSYQASAVSNYLTNHNPGYKSYNITDEKIPENSGIYNAGGRGYPDLSAWGDHGVLILGGEQIRERGTSMSAPLVAAIFNRINEERLKAGKATVGFVNPTLYAHPEIFNDVTIGNQKGGGSYGHGCLGSSGFSAVPGWDPVTGLGTPNYPKFLSVFSALQ